MKTFKQYLTEAVNLLGTKAGKSKPISSSEIKKYIGTDEIIDVSGDVDFIDQGLVELPVKFGTVTGHFYATKNKLINLKNSPKEIHGDFLINKNDLSDLKDSPEIVKGSYNARVNKLISLEGAPKKIGGDFAVAGNPGLRTLKHCPETVGGIFDASFCSLQKLDFIPREASTIDLSHNSITSLVGISKKVALCELLKLDDLGIKEGGIGLILIPNLKMVTSKNTTKKFVEALTIITKYFGKGKSGLLACQEELEEAGLEAFAKL